MNGSSGTSGAAFKSGSVANSGFTGTPLAANVTFSSSFSGTNFSVVVTGGDARIWTVENISVSGFTINSNSDTLLSYSTYWIASQNV